VASAKVGGLLAVRHLRSLQSNLDHYCVRTHQRDCS
jgi:hypothetical protein